MRWLAIISAAVISGCATYQHPAHNPTVVVEVGQRTTQVAWVVVEDVNATCRQLGIVKYPGMEIYACARWRRDFSYCEIYTGKNTTHHALGHELQHCFDGNYHK